MDTDNRPIHTSVQIGEAYFHDARELLTDILPKDTSNDAIAIASSHLAIAMSIAHLSAAVSGGIEGSPILETLRSFVEKGREDFGQS